jgi:cellulose synthase/poly-beta-1,6-N-acetylglucosamine synthase-like glycosyltransferase
MNQDQRASNGKRNGNENIYSVNYMYPEDENLRDLEYHPLVLMDHDLEEVKDKDDPNKNESTLYMFDGNPESETWSIGNFKHFSADSIIGRQSEIEMKLMIWVTMYNEPYKQFIETMAGVFRGYYELWGDDASYEGKVSVVVVWDGYFAFDDIEKDSKDGTFAEKLALAGLYDKNLTKEYRYKKATWQAKLEAKIHEEQNDEQEQKDEENKFATSQPIEEVKKDKDAQKNNEEKKDSKGDDDYEIKYSELKFLNKKAKKEEYIESIDFETNNLAHCFSRKITFNQLMKGLPIEEAKNFKIDDYSIENFMFGDSAPGKCKHQKYTDIPMDIHFLIKHKNRAKIESHQWFFKGFCNKIKPEFWFIIDAGTIALWNSISMLIFHMETFKNVGGAWGEIEVMLPEKDEKGQSLSFYESVILRSQYVEYKISHYLDKAAESLFGFVSVLPGAFSAFRWKAIKGEPLRQFLRGQTLTDSNNEIFPACKIANKYLAEDRIMCLEIVAKQPSDVDKQGYTIEYVPGCKALTDAPTKLTPLIKQRRRWFNGSMFATFHVLFSMYRVWKSGNSFLRKFFFMWLYLYMLLTTLVGYFIVGLFYASFSIFVRSIFDSDDCLSVSHAANVLENLYLTFLFFCLILSVWVKVEWAEIHFRVWSVFMGIFAVLMIVSMVYFYFESKISSISIYFFIILWASYISPLIFNFRSLKFTDFLKGIVYVIFMSPTYININSIYAVSNIHDVSWGSRQVDEGNSNKIAISNKKERMDSDYQNYRSKFLIIWLLLNNAAGFIVVLISRNNGIYYLFGIGALLVFIVGAKIVFSIIQTFVARFDRFLVNRHIKSKPSRKKFEVIEYDDPDYQRKLAYFEPFERVYVKQQQIEDPVEEEKNYQTDDEQLSPYKPEFILSNQQNTQNIAIGEESNEDSKGEFARVHNIPREIAKNGNKKQNSIELYQVPNFHPGNEKETQGEGNRDNNITQEHFNDVIDPFYDKEIKDGRHYHRNKDLNSKPESRHSYNNSEEELKLFDNDAKYQILHGLENETESNQDKMTSKLLR